MELNRTNLEGWQIGQDDLIMFKEELRAKKDKITEKFEEENKELIERINKLSDEQDLEKSQFKEQAIELFNKIKEKKLLGGLGIREGINLIYEEEKAFSWAKEHDLALSLDKKRFEQLAKTEVIDFVNKEPKITVTFPKEIKF